MPSHTLPDTLPAPPCPHHAFLAATRSHDDTPTTSNTPPPCPQCPLPPHPESPPQRLFPFAETCPRPQKCSHHRTNLPCNALPAPAQEGSIHPRRRPVVSAPFTLQADSASTQGNGNRKGNGARFVQDSMIPDVPRAPTNEAELARENERLRAGFAVMYADCEVDIVREAARVCAEGVAERDREFLDRQREEGEDEVGGEGKGGMGQPVGKTKEEEGDGDLEGGVAYRAVAEEEEYDA